MKRELLFLFAASLLSCLIGAAIRGIPYPIVHDEFSYLIQGATFAQGQAAFPAPAFPQFFETFHVLAEPNYVSKYFPAQGVCVAFGLMVGHPILGIWLNMALVALAASWMTRAYLPSAWGRIAGALTIASFGFFHFFSQSYYGGGIPLLGGMLVVGGIGRILKNPGRIDAHLAFLGGSFLLFFSRPYEGFFFCLVPGIAYLIHWMREARRLCRLDILMLPVIAAVLALGTLAAYNHATTGHGSRLAYLEYHQHYFKGTLGVFHSKSEKVPAHAVKSSTPQSFEERLDLLFKEYVDVRNTRHWVSVLISAVREWFLNNSQFLLPLLIFAWMGRTYRAPRFRLLWATLAVGSLGVLTTSAYWYQYISPLLGTLIVLSTAGLETAEKWCRTKQWPFRRYLVELLLFLVLANFLFSGIHRRSRENAEAYFASQPDNHLVLVSYADGVSPHDEWVYTLPPFDDAKIIWARDLNIPSRPDFLEYYRDRNIWQLELAPQVTRIHPLDQPEKALELEYPDTKKNQVITWLRQRFPGAASGP